MRALALLILLLSPSLALAQQQYYGTRAESVSLPAPGDPRDVALLTIHAGDTVTPENVRSSIQALYQTGRYRNIAADATAGASGTNVSFLVTSQFYFSTFRLEPAELLPRSISSYFQLPLGKKFSKPRAEKLAAETEKLLEDEGFFNVSIEPNYIFDDQTGFVTVELTANATSERARVGSVQFRGGQQIISDKDLASELKVSNNDSFNADKLDNGIDRIRKKYVAKGYVTAKVQSARHYDPATNRVDLEIELTPGKTTTVQIFEATSSGNVKADISNTKLRMLVPIYEEGTVDADLVEEGRLHIVDYYQGQGYFDAAVTASVNEGTDQPVNVEFIVTKGDQHRVRSVRVVGSAYFSESEILGKMKTREGKSGGRGLFRPDLLESDIRNVNAMYQLAGFQTTEIMHSESESDAHDIDITIHIREGLRSVLDQITYTGNDSFTEPVLWQKAGIQADQVYSSSIIEGARSSIAAFYYANGFSEIRVDTRLDFDNANNTVNVRFELTEGPQYRIGWIFVAGNTHTAEKVITRSSRLKRDDLYNPKDVLEAQQRLYGLGIFDRVDIVTLDQESGPYKNLLIQVEDAKPIIFVPGFGVTDREGARATIEVSDVNLFGLARTLSARVRAGQLERQLQASYRDPRLFNHDIQGIASLRFDKTRHLFFNSNEVDFSLQTVRKLSQSRTLSLLASYETVNLQDIKVNSNFRRFPDATGIIQIARIGSSFVVEKRDNVADPARGTLVTADLQVASKLYGSEVNFTSFYTQGSHFTPVRYGVVGASTRIGWKQPYGGDKELPISERFFAGGSTTLRGFRLDTAGPPGGGQLLTIANLEYRIPLEFLPIRNFVGALFYDTGNVFERPSDFGLPLFTHTAGVGLRYKTPLGPIRTDIGFNLRPRGNERTYCVFFTLGNAF